MNIQWTILQANKTIQVMLVYNIYTGSKKLNVDGKEILSFRKIRFNNEIKFNYNNKEYRLQLIPEGYGYTGYVIPPDGEKIYPEVNNKPYTRTPLWIIPFVLFNMAIPIVSVEAFTPWLIGISSSYMTSKLAQKSGLNLKVKVAASFAISLLAWVLYYIFYLLIKKYGMSGGFISFK